jgi:UDP-N-acetylmuramyl tripeptide synthase
MLLDDTTTPLIGEWTFTAYHGDKTLDGLGNTAATVGDTTITGAAFKAFASTPTRSGLVVTAVTSFTTAEANINIQEAGLLTASGGVLFNRLAPIGPFNKTTAVSLDVTVQITQS